MKKIVDAKGFAEILNKMADAIAKNSKDFAQVALVGVHRRGIPITDRLIAILEKKGVKVLRGILDINLYRDDLSEVAEQPVLRETRIDFNVDGKVIYIIDDVLYTGRTTRAALNALFDLGRPAAVFLAVVASRTGRELPVEANVVGITIDTKPGDNVKVLLAEVDGEDGVKLEEGGT